MFESIDDFWSVKVVVSINQFYEADSSVVVEFDTKLRRLLENRIEEIVNLMCFVCGR